MYFGLPGNEKLTITFQYNMFLKVYPLEAKTALKNSK